MKVNNTIIKQVYFLIALIFSLSVLSASATEKSALTIAIDGAITPVVAEYVTDTIKMADTDTSVKLIVIEIDTPGGLDTSMRQIVKGIQASKKAIVVFVSPSGSRAASAGAFITIAAHVAAMAPGTNIGSASPVNMGKEMGKTMENKVTNDAAAYMRSLATLRTRNPDIAEKFVREAYNLPAKEALERNVIDLVAKNIPDLLKQINGKKIKTATGEKVLSTDGIALRQHNMHWRQKIFGVLADPNVAYMLMMLGFYGLFFELSNPGSVFPGVVGAISLILGLYSLQALPINYSGFLLIVLALVLFLLEVKVPSYGILTIGGVGSLIIGSMMLVDSPADYLKISFSLIASTAFVTGAFFFFIIVAALKIQTKKTKTGREGLLGAKGVAETTLSSSNYGKAFVMGELWDAKTEEGTIKEGVEVEVLSADGLKLTVKEKT